MDTLKNADANSIVGTILYGSKNMVQQPFLQSAQIDLLNYKKQDPISKILLIGSFFILKLPNMVIIIKDNYHI